MGFGGTSPQDQVNAIQGQVDKNKQAYDDYLKMVMGIVGGSGYDFLSPKTTTTTGNTSSTTSGSKTGTTVFDQLSMPEISPEYQKLEGLMRGVLEGRMYEPLPPGMLERSTALTNQAFAGAAANARNNAAKGMNTMGQQEVINSARAGKIADQGIQYELARQEAQDKNINLAKAVTEAFGRGQHTTGTSTTNELLNSVMSGTSQGSSTAPGDIGELLAYLGILQPYESPIITPTPQQGWGGPAIGAAGTIAAAVLL